MLTHELDRVLGFWFPKDLERDPEAVDKRVKWWFGGGSDATVLEDFKPLHQRATEGRLDEWASNPRSRLALIIVLDQFSRSLYRGTPGSFSQDTRAINLTLEGLSRNHYEELATFWEKTFFLMPLQHSEDLEYSERGLRLREELVDQAPPPLQRILEFAASQARSTRDVVKRFGRQPHRNAVLGRESTPEERQFLENE